MSVEYDAATQIPGPPDGIRRELEWALQEGRRDAFAMAALTGLLAMYAGIGQPPPSTILAAKHAVAYADALIAELDKKQS